MRCYCVTHHGQPLELLERPVPQPQGTEVLLKVRAAGVCHTDLHLWEGHYDLGGGKKLTLAERGIKPQSLGVVRPGGFAEYVVVPHPRYLVDIDGLDAAEAAPLACAGVTTYSALKKFGDRIRTDPVVIIGAGGLGLMAIEVLKALGGKGAIVVDLDPAKREAALAAGALQAVDARASDAAAQIQQATGGGARAVLDLVGATPTVTLAMACSARGGHTVICGLMGGDLTLALPVIPMRPLTLQGSYVGTLEELRELVALAQRRTMKPIPVTRRPLAEANDALMALHEGRIVGRTILVP